MNFKDILAVVVSYNGFQEIRKTVDAVRTQVGHVHIVDNGSDKDSLDVLASLEGLPDVTVERLGENRGVGYALNRGVLRARQTGYSWLLTMDQDSLVDGSLVEAYRMALEQDPTRVCLVPEINSKSRRMDVGGNVVRYAITSGNLVRTCVFDEIGLYDEGLFVDGIDFDFCLRLRAAGYSVHRIPAALMQHQLGDRVDLPRIVKKFYARHSPVRRYYMYRNYMYLAERYLLGFPGFIIKLGILQALLSILILFFDENPLASYRAIARGLCDYVVRKSGPYAESAV